MLNQNEPNDPGLKYDVGKPAYELLDSWVFESFAGENFHSCWVLFQLVREGDWAQAVRKAASYLGCHSALRHEMARVLEFGASKYGANNWRLGMKWSRVVGAAYRHLAAFERGELNDPESGLHHLGHFGCCMMFLAVYERDGVGTNDLKEVMK